MTGKFDMSDYVPVNERIESFVKAYPEGSIQSEIVELTGSRVTVKAYAYRTPGDPRPGVGHSSLEIPGSTPYTRGSEIENAETSAWGRAIAALGFEVKRGIASHEEVRNKVGTEQPPRAVAGAGKADPPQPSPVSDEDPSALFDDVLAVTGGTEVPPTDLQERIDRAAAKGQRPEAKVCPEHGSERVKTNKRGLYCATKIGDGWCDWSAAA
ncbi:MAG: hypothetical protein ABIS21_08335 [Acidimicrobiales bacterium]